MSCRVDQFVRDRRDGVLPQLRLLRNQRAQVARDRPHVAVRQLEPRLGEGVGELVRVLVEAPRDLLVGRVDPQREVGRQHRRRDASSTDRGRPGPCRRQRRPSASTDSRRPDSWSAPIRSSNRFLKKLLLHFVGVVVQVTSRPLVIASRPCRCRSCSSSRGPAPRGAALRVRDRRGCAGPAPCVLPKVCPPAISATVSSSFIAMRRNVSRMSRAAATGPGCRSALPDSRR